MPDTSAPKFISEPIYDMVPRGTIERCHRAMETALHYLRETVPDPCACWGATGCDLHEVIADLEEAMPEGY